MDKWAGGVVDMEPPVVSYTLVPTSYNIKVGRSPARRMVSAIIEWLIMAARLEKRREVGKEARARAVAKPSVTRKALLISGTSAATMGTGRLEQKVAEAGVAPREKGVVGPFDVKIGNTESRRIVNMNIIIWCQCPTTHKPDISNVFLNLYCFNFCFYLQSTVCRYSNSHLSNSSLWMISFLYLHIIYY